MCRIGHQTGQHTVRIGGVKADNAAEIGGIPGKGHRSEIGQREVSILDCGAIRGGVGDRGWLVRQKEHRIGPAPNKKWCAKMVAVDNAAAIWLGGEILQLGRRQARAAAAGCLA